MKKARVLAVAVFLIAISVISYDAFAAVQGMVINIDLKTLGGITKKDAAKEYKSYQKWSSFGAMNSSGKTKSIQVNIVSGNDKTDWKDYPYIDSMQDPYVNVYKNSWMQEANKAYQAQIRTKGWATSTYSTQNAWYISY